MSGQPSRNEHPLSDPLDPLDPSAGVKRKRSSVGTPVSDQSSISSQSASPSASPNSDTLPPSRQDGTAATSVNNLPDIEGRDKDAGEEQAQTPTTSASAPTPTHAVVATSSLSDAHHNRLRYKPPQESRMPDKHWRLYIIKDGIELDVLHTHRQPSFLLGRDRTLADIYTDHPSCSKQHAVLQFREITRSEVQVILPFLVDLDSTNGTFVNGQRIPPHMFYELRASDVIKFASSTREYVLMDPDKI